MVLLPDEKQASQLSTQTTKEQQGVAT